jgi:hypothetical protein
VFQRQVLADIDGSPRQVAQRQQAVAALPPPRPNLTGLPDQLKAGVEHLSGHSLDDVQVHYNSPRPAQLQAHAFAQGTAIHLAPGQQHHLPHEAWHVAQQKQGRVKPTTQLKGVGINDDNSLEREATNMGNRAAATQPAAPTAEVLAPPVSLPRSPVQRYFEGSPSAETIRSQASDAGLSSAQIETLLANARDDANNFGQLANRISELRRSSAVSTALGTADDVDMQEPTAPVLERTPSELKRKRTKSVEGANSQPIGISSLPGLAPGFNTHPFLGGQPLGLTPTVTTEKRPEKRIRPNASDSLRDEIDNQTDSNLNDELTTEQETLDADILGLYGLDEQPLNWLDEEEIEEKSSLSQWVEEAEEKGASVHLGEEAEESSSAVWDDDVATHDEASSEEQASVAGKAAESVEEGVEEESEEEEVEEEEEAEEEMETVFDEARGLSLFSFGENDVQVLTETFTHGGHKRSRPVEWKIPFVKWSGGSIGKRTTPPPMSLFSAPNSKKEVPRDQGFDPEGKYQFGHMLPASSGAYNHYALTTPMEQDTNHAGAWKKTEEAIDRILGKPNRAGSVTEPIGKEQDLADSVATKYAKKAGKGSGAVHIIAKYTDADGRIPSSYQVALYGTGATGAERIYKFKEIKNTFSRPGREKMPSLAMKALFGEMHTQMQGLDKQVAEAESPQRHATDNEWTPAQSGTMQGYPPKSIPEKHVPRPHRALDVLVKTLGGLSRKVPEGEELSPYDAKLAGLSPAEREEVDEVVHKTTYGSGLSFTKAQRSLAERHARFLDPRNENRFLSDTRAEALQGLEVPEKLHKFMGMRSKTKAIKHLRDMYLDHHEELYYGGGHARPEGDHHVPKSTGGGSNSFTNLLWVSHQQNMSSKAQNKPVNLTNPHMKQPLFPSTYEPSTTKGKKTPKKQKLSTVAKGDPTMTAMTAERWKAWQAARGAKPLVPDDEG